MKQILLAVLLVVALTLVACGTAAPAPTPEPIIIEVTKEVQVTVEGEPKVEKVVEEVVVTATPEPVGVPTSADPNTFIYATIGSPETFDPALVYETSGGNVVRNTYETLITYDREDATTLVPNLATEWEVSDDGLIYTFTIREGVTFHEGQEMTAEDVAYSFQRGLLQGGPDSPQFLLTEPFFGVGTYDVAELIDPELSGDPEGVRGSDEAKLIEVCEKVKEAVHEDGNQVIMTLAQPWSPFMSTLTGSWGSVMSKEWVIENGGWDGKCESWGNYYGVSSEEDVFTPLINGTGPYKLERWTPGEEVVLVANENYWRTEEIGPAFEDGPVGLPAIQNIVIQTVDEWGTRFVMLQAGDADSVIVPTENVSQVDPLVGERCDYNFETQDFDCAETENPEGTIRLYIGHPLVSRTDAMFVFDVNDEGGNNFIGSGELDGNGIPTDFFSDIHVRLGFNYCFDWEVYIQDALVGEAVQNAGPIIPGMIGYYPDGPKYSYDPDKCAEELALAWDGTVAENGFRMQVAYNTGNTTRQTIAEILQANLAAIDEKYSIETIGLPWPTFLRQIRESRLPLYISGWVEDIHDPHNWAQPFLVGTYARRQNFPEEMIAQFKELVDAGVVENDPEKRQTIYEQVAELDYENAVAIRLAVPSGRVYTQRWIDGWFYNPAKWGFDYYMLTKK